MKNNQATPRSMDEVIEMILTLSCEQLRQDPVGTIKSQLRDFLAQKFSIAIGSNDPETVMSIWYLIFPEDQNKKKNI